ncbi:MAG: biopolymer transporter ExbD [bacterium]
MNFSNDYDGGSKLDINLTPLIDVTLQLVIFFMITTSFMAQTGIDVRLPKASTKDLQQEKELVATITREKKIYLNEDMVSLAELPDRLIKARSQGSKSVLIVKADEVVPHGLVVSVMDIAKKSGIETLAIATRPEDEK